MNSSDFSLTSHFVFSLLPSGPQNNDESFSFNTSNFTVFFRISILYVDEKSSHIIACCCSVCKKSFIWEKNYLFVCVFINTDNKNSVLLIYYSLLPLSYSTGFAVPRAEQICFFEFGVIV